LACVLISVNREKPLSGFDLSSTASFPDLACSAASPLLPISLSHRGTKSLVPSHSLSLLGRSEDSVEAAPRMFSESPPASLPPASSSLSSTVVVVTRRRAAAPPPAPPSSPSSSEDEDVSAWKRSSSAAASPNLSGGRARREGRRDIESMKEKKNEKEKTLSLLASLFRRRRPGPLFSSHTPLF